MSSVSAIDISASGLEYQRMRMEAMATNIANSNIPRNNTSGAIFTPIEVALDRAINGPSWRYRPIDRMENLLRPYFVESSAPPKLVYEPDSPLANSDGFLEYPNIDLTRVMLDMMETTRIYQANLKAFSAEKLLVLKTIEMGA